MMGHMFMDVYHVWDPTMRMFHVKAMGLSWLYLLPYVKIEVEKPFWKKHHGDSAVGDALYHP